MALTSDRPHKPGPTRPTRWIAANIVSALLLICVAAAAYWLHRWEPSSARINAVGADLRSPAAWLDTVSLSALPRDLVRAPLLREVLSEDFVFYYEGHEDRLGVRGALRRIAYEHDPTLSDRLLDVVLDAPAEMAFWLDGKGAPRHWALAVSRGPLDRALQGIAALAMKDRQLTLLGELNAGPFRGSPQAVYALKISSRLTLAIAARPSRMIVFSDPGLLFDDNGSPDEHPAQVLHELLGQTDAGSGSVWRSSFGLAPRQPADAHVLVAADSLLGQGWQPFVPGVRALRADVGRDGARLDMSANLRDLPQAGESPWSALPMQPAACAAAPVDWNRVRKVIERAEKAGAAEVGAAAPLAEALDGRAAICWYARSQWHTPLVISHRSGPPPDPASVERLVAAWMPGVAKAATSPGGQGVLRAAGDWWLFSPDPTLVERAADVLARRYPSIADMLVDGSSASDQAPWLVVDPARIAELARAETLSVLKPQQVHFRQAAETQLWPLLRKVSAWPAVQIRPKLAPGAKGWVPVEITTMKERP